jgi:2-oxoglutarate decarboxylase
LHDKINLGLAIDLEGKNGTRSLVVPSMKNCGAMDFKRFLVAYAEVVDKARANKLTAEDFSGTTLTLANPGTLGTSASVPRLMAGQGAIIATGAIGYPAEWAIAEPDDARRPRHLEGHADDLDVRPSHHPRRRIRFLPGPGRRAPAGRRPLLRGGLRRRRMSDGAVRPPLSAPAAEPAARAAGHDAGALDRQLRVFKLIHAYRTAGARVANLDPLAPPSHHEPELDLSAHGLGDADLGRTFLTDGVGGTSSATLRDIVAALRTAYCGTATAEFAHVSDAGARAWLAARFEAPAAATTAAESRRILEKLSAAEALEKFLHTRYVGQKRFSVEGAETTIAVLDEILNRAADAGADEMVLGMAHRGRLNVLVNTFGKPCDKLFAEFEGFFDAGETNGSGDVKYHLGAHGTHMARAAARCARRSRAIRRTSKR